MTPSSRTKTSTVRIANIYPELLGTYGDGGNAVVLRQRLAWRGLEAEVVDVAAGTTVPTSCDIYLLGGGEDEPQTLAAEGLRSGELASAVSGGAVMLAVCAGFQIVGESFPGNDGKPVAGAGIIPVETRRSWNADPSVSLPRAVGDIGIRTDIGTIVGYENHGGRTKVLSGEPFGSVLVGVGNGDGSGHEGWASERVIGTYLHGPVLAQNSHLADHLLSLVVGSLPDLQVPDPGPALTNSRMRQLGFI